MKTILCYGDSNTFGYNPDGPRYAADVRWPGRLRALLGPGFEVVEEGCNNRTTDLDDPAGDWLNGLSSLRVCVASHWPVDVAAIMLGTNDLKAQFGREAAQVSAGVGRLVEEARRFGLARQGYEPQILVVSPIHIGWRDHDYPCTDFDQRSAERSRELAACLRELAERLGCAFLDAALYAEPGQADLVHLTSEGHASLAEAVAGSLRRMGLR